MVILGTVSVNFWLGAIAATALISGAAYSLWMYKRVYFGDVANDHVRKLTDINAREFGIMPCWPWPRWSWASTPSLSPM